MKSENKPSTINPQILFIVGATATGKSDLALRVAERLGGEIICADSQTIRRGLDIGTAKPSKEQQKRVKHYLIDIVEPYERFSVAEFQQCARQAISEIQVKGKLPIVVGGSGLYVDALFYDYDLSEQEDNQVLRGKLESMTVAELQQYIESQRWPMPENSQNPRHLIGTILRGGKRAQNDVPIIGAQIVGINRTDEDLKARIAKRIQTMFEQGLVDEVQSVLRTFGPPPKKFDALCYPIISRYLCGELTLDEAINVLNRSDWQYVRKQRAWFKRNPYIVWFTDENMAFEHICS